MEKTAFLRVSRSKSAYAIALGFACAGLLVPGCSEPRSPVAPAATGPMAHGGHETHVTGVKDEKGFIDGWFDGADVNLHYTKLYFCAEPPTSGADF